MTHPPRELTILRRSLLAQLHSDRAFGMERVPWPATAPRAGNGVRKKAPGSHDEVQSHPARQGRSHPGSRTAPRAAGKRGVPRVAPLEELLGPQDKRTRLERLGEEIAACQLCALARTRHTAVPGEGNVDADLLFVGEGPGADEDASGRPFVGRAGELLSRIIVAMGFTRESVFITNIVKCRPPGNRNPQPDETSSCSAFLERQLEIIQPKVICTLGLPATRTLLHIKTGISAVRGKKFLFEGIPLVPTFHPAYLLRDPSRKTAVWEDVQYIAQLVRESGGVIPNPPATPKRC